MPRQGAYSSTFSVSRVSNTLSGTGSDLEPYLREIGLCVGDDEPDQLLRPAAAVHAALRDKLRSDQVTVDELIAALEQHISDDTRFRMSLLACSGEYQQPGYARFHLFYRRLTRGVRSSFSMSTMRLLLSQEALQYRIVSLLLEKLPEFLTGSDFDARFGESVPRLILTHLMWLGLPSDQTQKLLEMVPVTSVNVQREIIGALPELVSDSDHEFVVRGCIDLMEANSELVVAVVECLSRFNLSADLVVRLTLCLLCNLYTPNIVKFTCLPPGRGSRDRHEPL